jgi:tRNA pseudouridine38-40 synthase
MTMPNYKLTIEYEGTRYSGWQAQGNTQKTVQGHLIRAASQVLGDVEVGGAGRTDAGVHAAGQVAHLRAKKAVDPLQLSRKINDLLPHDIHILDAQRANDRFHARHDAISRVYLYQISTRRTAFAKPFVWWIKDRLDFGAMQRASATIAGRHDFTQFSDKRMKEEDSRIVVVERCELVRSDSLILFRIEASHFLWKMVRKLVSFLAEVGRGSAKGDAIFMEDRRPLLSEAGGQAGAPVRGQAGAPVLHSAWQPTAPPSGLFLEAILYPRETFDRPLVPIVPVR